MQRPPELTTMSIELTLIIVASKMNKGQNMFSMQEYVKLIAKINFFIRWSDGRTDTVVA
jgi:hypothetical protein